jgi:signal transduction histidine kinase
VRNWSRIAATGLGAYCLGSFALWVVLLMRGRVDADDGGWLPAVAMTVALPVAVVLVARLPRHPLSAVLAVHVACGFTAIGLGPALSAPDGPAGPEAAVRIGGLLWLGGIPVIPVLITLFPDGVPAGRWRWLLHTQLAALGTLALLTAFGPPDHAALGTVAIAAGAVLIATAAVAAGRLVGRAVRDRAVRAQTRPVALVAAVLVGWYLVSLPLSQILPRDLRSATVDTAMFALLLGALPAAIGYAVVRRRLFDIDIVVSRLLVALTTTVVLGLAYLAAVAIVATLLNVPRQALAAMIVPAVLVAFLLVPAYRRLQALVMYTLYGSRGDPLTVLQTLGGTLARTPPDAVAERIAALVRSSLKLGWVAVEMEQDAAFAIVAQAGSRSAATPECFDLSYAGSLPGRLLVQPRAGEAALGRLDRRLLHHVAGQAGPAVAAARYVRELTLSRERLVHSREDERGRLRRDLHDGLSPALAGISLALAAARRMMRSDPDRADALLATAEVEAGTSWRDVRRILDDLRPPGLDELGLVGALEQRGRSLSRPDEFEVTVHGGGLPPLPPAVETAAYRIAVEAMGNAARHAHAGRCTVTVSADGALHLRVEDDGSGLPPDVGTGVGLQSMRSRTTEVGGRLSVRSGPGGGTTVVADLPLTES